MKKLLLLVIVTTLFAGCGLSLKEGSITKKWTEPYSKRHTTETSTQKVGNTTIMQTHQWTLIDNPDWCITIEGYNKRDKFRTRDLFVSEEMYHRLSVGDWFSSEDGSTFDPNNQKLRGWR